MVYVTSKNSNITLSLDVDITSTTLKELKLKMAEDFVGPIQLQKLSLLMGDDKTEKPSEGQQSEEMVLARLGVMPFSVLSLRGPFAVSDKLMNLSQQQHHHRPQAPEVDLNEEFMGWNDDIGGRMVDLKEEAMRSSRRVQKRATPDLNEKPSDEEEDAMAAAAAWGIREKRMKMDLNLAPQELDLEEFMDLNDDEQDLELVLGLPY